MKTEEKIYYAFYKNKKEWLYFNELKRHTSLSNSSIQNALRKLSESKEIVKNKETSNIFYRLSSKNKIALNFSAIDLERLENLNFNVKIPLKDFLENSPRQVEFIILFGSASRKEEKNDSDIDLLVVLHKFSDNKLQEKYEAEIKAGFEKARKAVNSRSNYSLSIAFTNIEEFKTSKDHLVLQAKETGFPIFGNFQYYNEKN